MNALELILSCSSSPRRWPSRRSGSRSRTRSCWSSAGLALAFIPGLPTVNINPELVLLLFLPPLLFAAAWFTSWRDFAANRRPIALLAIGLVVVTTTAVAWVAHAVDPGDGLAGRVRAGRDRVAARRRRRHRGHPAAQGPAPDRHHPGGREPGERRHRPGRLPLRAGGGRRRAASRSRTPRAASRSLRRAAWRSASSSAGSSRRSTAAWRTSSSRPSSPC